MGRKKKEISKEIEANIETDNDDSVLINRDLKFISSGSTNLNLALTNTLDSAYPVGKIVNIVGDKQLGKSLMCLEMIMYSHYVLKKNYDVRIIYNDVEAAIDKKNAANIGLPVNDVIWRQSPTMEHWYTDLNKEIESSDKYDLLIYILDSLDGISTEEELEQDMNQKSYGMSKQKKLSELFRKLTQKINKKNVLLIIVSQIRDNIGVTFGETKRRSGGKALDFYASQIVWLYNKGIEKKGDVAIGIGVKAKVKKNRIWRPFYETDFNILFEYGIDDIGSMIDFLINNKYYKKDSNGRIFFENKAFSREDFIQFMLQNNQEEEIKLNVKNIWDKIIEDSKIIRKPKYPEIILNE